MSNNSNNSKMYLQKNILGEESQLKQTINPTKDITIPVNNLNEDKNNSNNQNTEPNITLSKKINGFGEKIGNLIILQKNTDGEIKYVMGILFPLCLLIDLIVNFFIYKIVYNNIPIIFKMIGTIINISQITLFIISSVSNPGLPLKIYETQIYEAENMGAKNFRQCKDCKLWINTDENTIHCRKCNICIEGYDHHCSCMNICVGKNNLKTFYISIGVSFATVFYSIIMTLTFK